MSHLPDKQVLDKRAKYYWNQVERHHRLQQQGVLKRESIQRERIHRRMNLIKTHRQRQGMQWRRRLKETEEGLEDNERKRGYEGEMYRPNDLCMNVVSKEEKSLSIFAFFIPIEQKEEYEWMSNDKRAESLVPSSPLVQVLLLLSVFLPPSVQLSFSIWS